MSLRGAVCSPGSTGRGKGQADSGIRLIEIPSSRTLNLPGEMPRHRTWDSDARGRDLQHLRHPSL